MRTSRFLILSLAVALFVLASGCTHMMHAPTTTVSSYPATEKINLKIGLAILPELTDAKYEFHFAGDKWLLPLGENLTRNSESLAKQLFSSVTVQNVTTAEALPGMEATLILRMKTIEQSSGAAAWTEAATTIVLEWSLKDSKNTVVWADTIRADAKSKLGTAFNRNSNSEKRVKTAIEKAFQDSFRAISTSPEIRKLAAGK